VANKTQETAASVDAFIKRVKPAAKRESCETLRELMERVSGEPAKMWGSSIVGFGTHHYKYESGREGDICKVGFSPRAQALVIYGLGAGENEKAIAALGKVKTGKGCVYLKSVTDVDLKKLESLLRKVLR
jgi:hypothetical protein